MADLKYRADIDGLRAIAVLLVLAFHTDLAFPGGFIGVDVFFVISGFLITGLVQNEQKNGTFKLGDFWMRRVRRIVPASVFVVLVTLFVGYFILLPDDYVELAKSAASQQLIFSNVFFWKNTGYFNGPAELKPLLHTWSLAVEEQFYLGYPLALIVFLRTSRRLTVVALIAMISISFGLSEYGVANHPSATFYFLPTRAWELLIGGMICFLPTPNSARSWQLELLSGLSVGVIFVAASCFSPKTPFPGVSALLPCGASAALIYANSSRLTWVGRLLGSKPIVFVGLRSYSLYLWHWPLVVFLRYVSIESLRLVDRIFVVLGSLGLAYLSYRFVETPFRRSSIRVTRKTVFISAFISTCSILLISLLVVGSDGVTSRFSGSTLRLLKAEPLPHELETVDVEKAERGEFPRLGIDKRSAEAGVGALSPEGSRGCTDFVVWGDSHALPFSTLIDRTAKDLELSGKLACLSGCVPVLDAWYPSAELVQRGWNQAVFDWICENDIKNVILVCRWEAKIGLNLIVDASTDSRTPDEAMAVLHRALTRTVAALERRGICVWIMGQVPLQKTDPRKLAMISALGHRHARSITLADHLHTQARTLSVFSKLKTGHTFLDPTPYCFDAAGYSRIADETGSFYFDDDHLSLHGAETLLAPLVESLLTEIAKVQCSQPRNDSNGRGK